ncbi:hypothetical protein RIF29_38885 [Crotalaria pallida]|uniref:FBD domain-containing protein n=1 Tax=Crotalaria pallida TaxID=3830 RepID=A0AAN9HQ57_CROPI
MDIDRLRKRQKANDGHGIFSKLTEPLISRILSFLSTKDAVRTSVLSKKWRYRWTIVTKLDLNDSLLYSGKKTSAKQYFVNFVYRALLLTKCPSFESFSLAIANKYDVSLLNSWISSVLNWGVKNLRINSLHSDLPFSALTSHFLFNSINLEELVLEMYHCSIVVPTNYFYLGHLKFLKLNGITFTLEDSGCSESLKLSFPVLKEFETINCAWLIANGITVEAPLLERVFIDHYPEYLFSGPDKCAIKFSASCLKEFTYHGHGDITQDVVLLDSSSANNASANIILYKDSYVETGTRVILLLKQLYQVLAQSRVDFLPSFNMLSHLELGLVTWEVLLGLLQKSPILKRLVFKGLSEFDPERLNFAIVPYCFVSSLQILKFGNVQGYEHELCLAKFMMENCLVLERMSFSLDSRFRESKALEEFKEKLLSFRKGSVNFAFVEFSYNY